MFAFTNASIAPRSKDFVKCRNSPRAPTGACRAAAGPWASPLSVALTHNWYTSELRSLNRYQSVADARSKVRKSLSIFSPHIQNATPPTLSTGPSFAVRPLVI